ncbi:MAG TPA: alpha/beta fold hydrolase [Gemmatimonadaceae bacterium]
MRGRLAPAEMFPAGVPHVRTRTVTLAGGVRLRVAEAGEADAPPVLLLHGWGASLYMWRDWFGPLAASGRRAIALDLPGHGLSDKPLDAETYRLDGQVAVLRELIVLEELTGVAIVAQSMSGTIALELALRGEPRLGRLALVNPASFGRIPVLPFARLASPPLLDRVLHRLVGRWVVSRAHRLAYGDPRRLSLRDREEYWAPSQFPAYARAMRRLVHEFPWARPPADVMARRLRALTAPVLVVLGTRDRLVRDAAAYVEALRAAGAPLVLREVEGGGHAVNEELPENVLTVVLAFLDGLLI